MCTGASQVTVCEASQVTEAKSLQSCFTLCNPVDCYPPGSSVHDFLPARILKWVAMPSSRGSSQPRDRTHISYVFCFGGWVFTSSATNSVVKNLPANEGDTGDTDLIPGLGKSPGGGNGNPLQHSCLGYPMDRGAWTATVHGVPKSQTQLSNWAHTHIHCSRVTWKTRTSELSRVFNQDSIYTVGYLLLFVKLHPTLLQPQGL